jgi:hypothetical protein
MQAPALKENFDTPETSIFDELVEREQFQVRFPENTLANRSVLSIDSNQL